MKANGVSFAMMVLFTLGLCSSGWAQTDKRALHTFVGPDGQEVSARIYKYSTSSQMVTLKTEEGLEVKLMFDEISPENQKTLLEWKIDQIVQSSNFVVTYKRIRGDTDESYIRGTNVREEAAPIQYELTLENKERIPITGLTIQYGIAYKRSAVKGRSVSGGDGTGFGYHLKTLSDVIIAAKETKVMESPITFLKTFVDTTTGGYGSGGRGDYADAGGKSKEDFKGVVFRFSRHGVLLREEASPSSLVDREFSLPPNDVR